MPRYIAVNGGIFLVEKNENILKKTLDSPDEK
jgi:hypothetical protein